MLREQRVQCGAVALNYAEGAPQGPPLVLLHGGAGSWRSGAALLAALVPRWHVFAPDFRGHGASGHVPGRYHLRDYVQDTIVFLERLVDSPAVLYGHSLGGEVALTVAARRPDLVRAVIDGDAPLSTTNHPTEEPTHKAMNRLWHAVAGRPVAEIVPALWDTPVPAPDGGPPRRAADVFGAADPWFAFQAQNLAQLDPDVLAAVLAGPAVMLEGYEAAQLLPAIRCPVLLLQGDPAQGGLLREEEVGRGEQLLAHAQHVRLEGIGHELHGPADNVPRVLQAITPFLERVRSETLPSGA